MKKNKSKAIEQQEQRRKVLDFFSGWVRLTLVLGLSVIITLFTNNNLLIFGTAMGLIASLGFTSWLWFKKILPLNQQEERQ